MITVKTKNIVYSIRYQFKQDFMSYYNLKQFFCMLIKYGNMLALKSKVVYNPLRLGAVIVLVSSGIDFVNTPRLYSDRATR